MNQKAQEMRPMPQQWVWIELIGFDNALPDYGVEQYCQKAGFIPDAISILMSHSDIILQHFGVEDEIPLPVDICSRLGHSHNQDRKRQNWSNWQIRNLVASLHRKGIKVFLSVFAYYCKNKFHNEFASDHEEILARHLCVSHPGDINPLTRFKNGDYFEDFFVEKLIKTVCDYGFDGWHGPDGWGPLENAIYDVDFSDDLTNQFQVKTGIELPEVVTCSCDEDLDKRKKRASWIWRNVRHEWINFYSDRWATFWRKASTRLHQAGKLSVINNAWARAPWESLYRYGIDYRKIIDAGVDAIVVETVASGLSMDPRPSASGPNRSYDMYSMLLLIRAYVPDAKLIFLLFVHDTVEQGDAIRHAPTTLEREIFNCYNSYNIEANGNFRPAADGALFCLGDGIAPEEWKLLNKWCSQATEVLPHNILGATLVWSDQALFNQIQDFTKNRTWDTHRILSHLMEFGAPIRATLRTEHFNQAKGTILVINSHLMLEEERQKIVNYKGGPIVAISPDLSGLGTPDTIFEDVHQPRQLKCGIFGYSHSEKLQFSPEDQQSLPDNLIDIVDSCSFWDHMIVRTVSKDFLQACANIISKAVDDGIIITEPTNAITSMIMTANKKTFRIALKNKMPWYANATVDLGKNIINIEVKTSFPVVSITPEGSTFQVRVPPKGLVILDVESA